MLYCPSIKLIISYVYASCSIYSTEADYAISDLETLVVVWAVTHFCYYQYGHEVTIIIDHAAVKLFSEPQVYQENIPDGGVRCMAVV